MTRAEKNMAFVERHCIVPEGKLVGKPIKLADFQEAFFYSVYDNPVITYDAILSIARKNSKTATIATVVLVHLVGPEAKKNSEILSGARSRKQAAQVYRYASKMVDLSPTLSGLVRKIPSSKTLIGIPMNVEYQAGAAEASTNHGGSPVLAIIDEAGQVKGPHDDYIESVITSQGAHENPMLIVISTQASTDADLLSVWIDDAAKNREPSTVCHLYTTHDDEDAYDEKNWIYSNPALGLFRMEADMARMAGKAKRMPSAEAGFRNLYLNQRVNLASPFVSRSVWEQNSAEPETPSGQEAYGGLDLSSRTDLTAFVIAYRNPGEPWSVQAKFWAPRKGLVERSKRDRVPYDVWAEQGWLELTPGATVDYEYVARSIAEFVEDFDLQGAGYDRWRIDLMKKEFAEIGVDLPLIEFGQGYKDMSPALDTLEAELLNGRIRHGGNPILTMCAANAVSTRDPAGNRKLDKAKATGRIDGMVALAMAIGTASKTEEKDGPSVYEERGVLMFG
jgi:phage terminase large subunit-like protein